MPADPRAAQAFIRDPRFQSVTDPSAKMAMFRQYLATEDAEGFGALGADEQTSVASRLMTHFEPTWATTAGDVAEYVPVVGGAVRGVRDVEAGQPARPLTRALSGGSAPTAGARAVQEASRDALELIGAGAVTKVAAPVINSLARKFAGRGLEEAIAGAFAAGGAAGVVDTALGAATSTAARRFAGEAARRAIKERVARAGIENLTQGALFGATVALEGEIANGELPPLSDILGATAGAAALGMGFFGAGELLRKFRLRSLDEVVGASQSFDPERFAGAQRDISAIADAVTRASGGRLSRESAVELTFDALTKPIEAVGEVRALKDALRSRPEILGSDVGLHILRTQRKLVEPDITITDGPYLRVQYDNEAGQQVVEDLSEHAAQRAFAQRVAGGHITIDAAVGDQASLLRAGVRQGTPLEQRVPAVGARTLVAEGTPPASFEPLYGPANVPMVRPASAEPTLNDLAEIAAREVRTGGPVAQAADDLVGIRPPRTATLTDEAEALLASADAGGVPAFVSRNFRRILEENGIANDVIGRTSPAELVNLLRAQRNRVVPEAAAPVAPAVRSMGDLAASPEAISRLGRERGTGVTYAARDVRGKGRERVLPATVDRIDTRPGPFEVIVKRGATERDVIVEAGAKVKPAQLDRIRAEEVQRFRTDVAQRQARATTAPGLPAPTDIQHGVLMPDGSRVFTEPVVAPPKGVVAKASNGLDVQTLTDGDVLGRSVVELPSGVRAKVQWNPRLREFDVPPSLLDVAPIAAPARPPRLTGEPPTMSTSFRTQVRRGQVIHQHVNDLGKRGVRPSIEVLAVEGDRVLVRSGETVLETNLDTIARTIDGGTGYFAFDMTKQGGAVVEQLEARFKNAPVFTETVAVQKLTPAQRAADARLAEDLYSFNTTRANQGAAPGTAGPSATVGVRAKDQAAKRQPRTKGGTSLVKGCKIK